MKRERRPLPRLLPLLLGMIRLRFWWGLWRQDPCTLLSVNSVKGYLMIGTTLARVPLLPCNAAQWFGHLVSDSLSSLLVDDSLPGIYGKFGKDILSLDVYDLLVEYFSVD